jgi:hypothetical protein
MSKFKIMARDTKLLNYMGGGLCVPTKPKLRGQEVKCKFKTATSSFLTGRINFIFGIQMADTIQLILLNL